MKTKVLMQNVSPSIAIQKLYIILNTGLPAKCRCRRTLSGRVCILKWIFYIWAMVDVWTVCYMYVIT